MDPGFITGLSFLVYVPVYMGGAMDRATLLNPSWIFDLTGGSDVTMEEGGVEENPVTSRGELDGAPSVDER
jgi:hypothetical protein